MDAFATACAHSPQSLADRLESSCETGLPFDEAASRSAVAPNLTPLILPGFVRTSMLAFLRPQNLMLIAGAVLYTLWFETFSTLATPAPWRPILLWAALALAFALQVAVDLAAKRALATLAQLDLQSGVCLVLRGGRPVTVPFYAVVVGDVLLLRAGQRVAGDARLIEALALRTHEALLSGDDAPVHKDATAILAPETLVFNQLNMVFAHTRVQSGEARALVVATGEQTQVARARCLAINAHERDTHLHKQVQHLTAVTCVVSSLLIAATLALGWFRDFNYRSIVIGALMLAFACVPQQLPVLTRAVLGLAALGVSRAQRILIKKMACAAQLSAVTAIVTNKVGALTDDECALEVIGMYDRLTERQSFVPQASEVQYLRSLVHCWTLSAPPLSLPAPHVFQQAALRESAMSTTRLAGAQHDGVRRALAFQAPTHTDEQQHGYAQAPAVVAHAALGGHPDAAPREHCDSFDRALIEFLASCGPQALRMYASEVAAASTSQYDPLALLQLMRRQQSAAAAPSSQRFASIGGGGGGIGESGTLLSPRPTRIARLSSMGSIGSTPDADSPRHGVTVKTAPPPPQTPQRAAISGSEHTFASPTNVRAPHQSMASPSYSTTGASAAHTHRPPRYSEAVIAYFPFDATRKLSSCLRCAITADAAAASAAATLERQSAAAAVRASRSDSLMAPRYALPDSWTAAVDGDRGVEHGNGARPHRNSSSVSMWSDTMSTLRADSATGELNITAGARTRALQPLLGQTGFSYHSPREFRHLGLDLVDHEESEASGTSPAAHSFFSLSDGAIGSAVPPLADVPFAPSTHSPSLNGAGGGTAAPQFTSSYAAPPPDLPYTLYVRGAPEAVISRCVAVELSDGQLSLLPPASKTELLEHLASIAATGARVLALATRKWALLPVLSIDRLAPADVERELVFVGFVACADALRADARAAVDEARAAGIDVKLASGDHGDTCMHVARTLGISARDYGERATSRARSHSHQYGADAFSYTAMHESDDEVQREAAAGAAAAAAAAAEERQRARAPSPAPILLPSSFIDGEAIAIVAPPTVTPAAPLSTSALTAAVKSSAVHAATLQSTGTGGGGGGGGGDSDLLSSISRGGREMAVQGSFLERLNMDQSQTRSASLFGHTPATTRAADAAVDLVRRHSVFARCTPAQRFALVDALQRAGHRVALASGASADCVALEAADAGVARDVIGADAARQTAGAVLYDRTFVTLVRAIRACRRMVQNLRLALVFSLACKFAVLFLPLAIFSISDTLPLNPMSIVVLGALIDAMAATSFTHARLASLAAPLSHSTSGAIGGVGNGDDGAQLTFGRAFAVRCAWAAVCLASAGAATMEVCLHVASVAGTLSEAQSATFLSLCIGIVALAWSIHAGARSASAAAMVDAAAHMAPAAPWLGDRQVLCFWTLGVACVLGALCEAHVRYAFSVDALSLKQVAVAVGSPLAGALLHHAGATACGGR